MIPRINTNIYGEHSIRYVGPVNYMVQTKYAQWEFWNTFKNQVRKVDIENLLRTDICKNCHKCNS